ncbi:MAG: hypothetical protein AABY10_06250, partial [Nanoarchaeota archaeon]
MKIGIDIDEVTADFFQPLLDYYNKKYGRNDKQEDFEEWKWWPVWGISKEEAISRADEFHEVHTLEEVKPIEDSINSINELLESNEIFFITSRPLKFKNKAENWVLHHFGKPIKVINSGDFYKGQAATKAEICKELKIPVLIEDSGETAVDCAENGIKVLLFDKPWNKKFSHKNIIRVQGWKEAMR